jgi:hypothetical protein
MQCRQPEPTPVQRQSRLSQREDPMFDSLDEDFIRNDQSTSTTRERRLFYAVVILVSIILFGGLYAGLRYLE